MIELNKVGVEIDGKVYHFRKMSFGFQRRMVELQSNIAEKNKQLAKKYDVAVDKLDDEMSAEDKLEVAKMNLGIQDVIASLFVNPEQAAILDNFDSDAITQLITALQ